MNLSNTCPVRHRNEASYHTVSGPYALQEKEGNNRQLDTVIQAGSFR